MYNILIVDNERIDREGIKLLISKYGLNLNVSEADSGKLALAHMEEHAVDILLSDIKMPLMDGLELAQRARELHPSIKIVIFSAFGEFDYAKKAILIGVAHYILKPIRIDEFLNVMERVIALCEEEERERKKEKTLLEGYHKGVQYEKEKVMMDMLHGMKPDDGRIEFSGVDFAGHSIVMIMLDFKERFYDTKGLDFEPMLRHLSKWDFEYLNLNEYQSIVFVKLQDDWGREHLEPLGNELRIWIEATFDAQVCVVFSQVVHHREEIHCEFANMEKVLEYKFFYDDSVLLFAAPGGAAANNGLAVDMDSYLDPIFRCIEAKEYANAGKSIEHFFAMLQEEGSLSVIYVKYVCTEITKKLFKSSDRLHMLMQDMAEKIYMAPNMYEIKSILLHLVKQYGENTQSVKQSGKTIAEALDVIHQEYMNEISLEYVADKVYLSPSYLSHLFKKETGQSFMKYVTSYRFERSLELLAGTSMRISDISRSVGYNSHSYFCSIFKSYYGISPAQYRERRS